MYPSNPNATNLNTFLSTFCMSGFLYGFPYRFPTLSEPSCVPTLTPPRALMSGKSTSARHDVLCKRCFAPIRARNAVESPKSLHHAPNGASKNRTRIPKFDRRENILKGFKTLRMVRKGDFQNNQTGLLNQIALVKAFCENLKHIRFA